MIAEPLVAVDRILRVTPASVETLKYLSANELVFVGHYPHFPIYPGVFVLETMLQSIAIWSREHTTPLDFTGVRSLRLFSPSTPGDVLLCVATLRTRDDESVIFDAVCSCEGRPVAKAAVAYALAAVRRDEPVEAAS